MKKSCVQEADAISAFNSICFSDWLIDEQSIHHNHKILTRKFIRIHTFLPHFDLGKCYYGASGSHSVITQNVSIMPLEKKELEDQGGYHYMILWVSTCTWALCHLQPKEFLYKSRWVCFPMYNSSLVKEIYGLERFSYNTSEFFFINPSP